ncbi:MAG: DUF4157 domain-containing protein [Myxococcales bacterium]|nr:DUF4157 domain-containing protein [Myxococcales bacterium]
MTTSTGLGGSLAHDTPASERGAAPRRSAPGKVTRTERIAPSSAALQARADRGRPAVDGDSPEAPISWTLVQRAVAVSGPADDPFALHTLAARGVAGGGGALPHLAAIQESFGHHDVSGVRAHVGGAAADAAGAIGAHAYATGDDVAFGAAPDLHLAAHEAAHVVQQRGGVQLAGGVGQVGDPYEQHADAVADAVVRGESAAALLDTMAGRGAAGGPAVQRLTGAERTRARTGAVNDLTLEQLAHRIAYYDSTDQLSAEDRTALGEMGFDVERVRAHHGEGDLQFWVFPRRADAGPSGHTPVIAFRGSRGDEDFLEDTTGVGVGMGQFSMNQALIERELTGIGAGRGVVATGHSLGGALAEITAAYYPNLVVSVVTFQAPGISRAVIERLRSQPAGERPTAHHYRVHGCVVDNAGEGSLPGAVTVFDGGGADNPLHAHTMYPLLSQQQDNPPWMRAGDALLGPAISPSNVSQRRDTTTSAGAAAQGRDDGPGGEETARVIAGELTAEGQRRDAYARVWTLHILPHAQASDITLIDDMIRRQCADEGIGPDTDNMLRNYREMFPELAAADEIMRSYGTSQAAPAEDEFIAAVEERAGLGGAEASARIHRYWRAWQGGEAARPNRGAAPARTDRPDDGQRDGTRARLDGLRDRQFGHDPAERR